MGGFGAACAAATGEMVINVLSVLWLKRLTQFAPAVAKAEP
jgi:hypothetical protein